jgi:hypothetical protein
VSARLHRGAIALAAALNLAPPVWSAPAAAAPTAGAMVVSCPAGTYENSRGRCVRRPTRTPNNRPPAGATARCRDGTYSFSQSRRGTCSHHGGVAAWL